MNFRYVLFFPLIWIGCNVHGQILSLEQCRSMALEHNKKIKVAQLEIAAAQKAAEVAHTSKLPEISASAMALNVGKPLNALLPPVLGNASVSASLPIYVGGKIRLGEAASQKAIELYEAKAQMTKADVLIRTEQAFWQLIQVSEKIKVAEEYKKMLQALRTDLKNAFDAGLIYKNDLLKVDVSLNETELNLTKIKDGLTLAKLNLSQLIGQPGNMEINVQTAITDSVNYLSPEDFNQAANQRPEIITLHKAIEIQELQTKITQADLKPTVALSVSGFGALGKQVNFSNGKDLMISYYGLASVSIPIFDWGKVNKKAKEQMIKKEVQQAQLDESKELINLEIQNAYLAVNQTIKGIELSRLSLAQAEENLKLANDRFKAGTVVGKDVLEAQAIWEQARNGVIDSKIAYMNSLANYRKAVGTL